MYNSEDYIQCSLSISCLRKLGELSKTVTVLLGPAVFTLSFTRFCASVPLTWWGPCLTSLQNAEDLKAWRDETTVFENLSSKTLPRCWHSSAFMVHST